MEKYYLKQHLQELKTRLVKTLFVFALAFCICYLYSQEIYVFLAEPLANILGGESRKIIYTGLTEAFFTYLKISTFAAFVIIIPFIAWQIYSFIAPGLYKDEKFVAKIILMFCPLLFWMGGAFVYYFVMPKAWAFFISFELKSSSLPLVLEARISEYLSLVMHLITAFGLAAELPVVLVILNLMQIVRAKFLIRHRRLAIVINFIIAGIITPPDIISQIALALPMTILYEISIQACKALDERKKNVRY
ncbi:MAG: twin-arginine translocase subunit TatC [Pseudomonadota bacterium]